MDEKQNDQSVVVDMTLRDEIIAGETTGLEFKEARPKDALKYVKTAVAFANEPSADCC